MRRKDREVTEFEEILSIIKKCDVCRLAIHDEPVPYILPLNFGMCLENGKIVLYFHGALEGKKYDLLKKNNHVGFEMDCGHKLVTKEEAGYCTMLYESVMGSGYVTILSEEEKEAALKLLMAQYHKEDFAFNRASIPRTAVMRLEVEQYTAKRKK